MTIKKKMDTPFQWKKSIDRIKSKIHKHKPIKITDDIEKKVIEIVTKDPRKDYGLPFSTGSLRVLYYLT